MHCSDENPMGRGFFFFFGVCQISGQNLSHFRACFDFSFTIHAFLTIVLSSIQASNLDNLNIALHRIGFVKWHLINYN